MNNGCLMILSLGKLFKVVYIAETIDEANAYCEMNEGCGVLDEDHRGRIYIAANEETKL